MAASALEAVSKFSEIIFCISLSVVETIGFIAKPPAIIAAA